jgi:GNAT superfamily N-acetyltransferase
MAIRPVTSREILSAPNSVALMLEYAAECSIPEIGQICPQGDMYEQMEGTGRFQCFGVFEGDLLTGFASVLVYVVPHYGKKLATLESLFIAREHRRGRLGSELMHTIEDYARKSGCVAIQYVAPAGGQLERLLHLLQDYRHSNTVFTRSL